MMFFPRSVLIWLWYQHNAGLVKWLWTCSLLFSVLGRVWEASCSFCCRRRPCLIACSVSSLTASLFSFLFLREPVSGGCMFLGICPLFPGRSARISCSVVILVRVGGRSRESGFCGRSVLMSQLHHFRSALFWVVMSPLNSCLHPCRGAPTPYYAGLPKDELSQESPFSGVEMRHLCCGC